ncbi:hypothetical protein TRVL_05323 [Trypanosoma vivax]|nr:hypothetical protein TRVL_05323 [Trypanosoma vivax]
MSRETLKALEEAQSAPAATPRGQDDADFMAAVALTLHAEGTHGGALGEAYEKLRGNATALDAGTQALSIARAHIEHSNTPTKSKRGRTLSRPLRRTHRQLHKDILSALQECERQLHRGPQRGFRRHTAEQVQGQ